MDQRHRYRGHRLNKDWKPPPKPPKKEFRKRTNGLTPTIHQEIVKQLKIGNYMSTAAAIAGISHDTFNYWMRIGRQEMNRREAGLQPDSEMDRVVAFAQDVRAAIAQDESGDVAHLKKAVQDGDVRAITFKLERRHPKKWGARFNVSLESEMNKLLDKLERHLPDPIYDMVLEAMAAPESDDDDEDESTS